MSGPRFTPDGHVLNDDEHRCPKCGYGPRPPAPPRGFEVEILGLRYRIVAIRSTNRGSMQNAHFHDEFDLELVR